MMVFLYHTGFLACDRDPLSPFCKDPKKAAVLDERAQTHLANVRRCGAFLYQKRVRDMEYLYYVAYP
jgi:hypothetical protein